MKLAFVYWGYENAGSMLDLRGYAQASQRDLGHEVVMYGPPNPGFRARLFQEAGRRRRPRFRPRMDDRAAVRRPARLGYACIESVPRHRRVVIDCDGAYNDPMEYGGDYNHLSLASSRYWIAVCDSISDKIFQPTHRPGAQTCAPSCSTSTIRPGRRRSTFTDKEFSMIYVGHTKFRWRGMSKVLRAIERVRDRVGRVALVGEGWAEPEDWMEHAEHKPRYFVDRDYLKKVGAEALPAVPYQQVAETINKGVFNPVVYRPLFEHLGLVTCRTFETPAAGTIPLFLLERDYVAEIFGEDATQLMLDEEDAHEKIIDVLERPERYAEIVMAIRRRLSPAAQSRGAPARARGISSRRDDA